MLNEKEKEKEKEKTNAAAMQPLSTPKAVKRCPEGISFINN